jgi:glutaredoxin-related protein
VFVKGEFVGGRDILVDMFTKDELEKYLRDKGVPLA